MYERFNTYSAERPILRKIVGWILIVYGFIALITPLTPGAALILFLGFELVGIRFLFTEKLKEKLAKKSKKSVE